MSRASDPRLQRCPKCNGVRVVPGKLEGIFKPPFLSWPAPEGATFKQGCAGCRDCGLVWALSDRLDAFMKRYCPAPANEFLPKEPCLACRSGNVAFGNMYGGNAWNMAYMAPAYFYPSVPLRHFFKVVHGMPTAKHGFACRDCGMLTTQGAKEGIEAAGGRYFDR